MSESNQASYPVWFAQALPDHIIVSEESTSFQVKERVNLHPRNLHRLGYDFITLAFDSPALKEFVKPNKYNNWSVDFSDNQAVRAFSKALLSQYYGITHWEFPDTYLCPPIPGRADYLHYLADLLQRENSGVLPVGKRIRTLDIGTGASCIYPLLGHAIYQWHFVASDIDPIAIESALTNIANSDRHATAVECRLQNNPEQIFSGIIQAGELFDLVICNPPFHDSMEKARRSSIRKWKILGAEKAESSAQNFAGQEAELMCMGGEVAFISRMIADSMKFPTSCYWFSSLVSHKTSLPVIYRALELSPAIRIETIEMSQGNKVSRFVAWSFLTEPEQAMWRQNRWA